MGRFRSRSLVLKSTVVLGGLFLIIVVLHLIPIRSKTVMSCDAASDNYRIIKGELTNYNNIEDTGQIVCMSYCNGGCFEVEPWPAREATKKLFIL